MNNCALSNTNTFLISYDDKNILKIWDVQEKTCIQTLNTDTFYGVYSAIIPLPFKDNFLVASRKLFQYSNTQHTAGNQHKGRVNRPLVVTFNNYFSSLMVAGDCDVRMVNCYTGRLEKVFVSQKVISNDNEKIVAFCEGTLQRKYYAADTRGVIDCFNSLNGEKIKVVNEPQEEAIALRKITEMLNVRSSQKNSKVPPDDPVTSMTYLNHMSRLVVGTQSSVIKMYDESNSESSVVLGVDLVQLDIPRRPHWQSDHCSGERSSRKSTGQWVRERHCVALGLEVVSDDKKRQVRGTLERPYAENHRTAVHEQLHDASVDFDGRLGQPVGLRQDISGLLQVQVLLETVDHRNEL